MTPYSRARPSGHWIDYPDLTYGVVGSTEFEKWDQAIEDLKYRVVDVKDYGLTSTAVASPEVLIQQACDDAAIYAAAATGSPVVVRVPPGNYTNLDVHLIPGQSGTVAAAAFFWFKDNVWLNLEGCTFKAKAGLTLPVGATRLHLLSSDTPYLRPAAGGVVKTNNRIFGGVFDGNANNQTYGDGSTTDGGQSPMLQAGIKLGFCKSYRVEGTKVQNVWGSAEGPTGEAFHIESWYCENGWFIGTEVDGSGATSTATGHAASNSQGIRYLGSISHDLAHGHGFTDYECGSVYYGGAVAQLCAAGSGFNTELGNGIAYAGVISGSQSLDVSLDGSFPHWAFPSGQISLSNDVGLSVQGSTDVTSDSACQFTYNTTYGVRVYGNASVSPRRASNTVLIDGNLLHNGASEAANWKVEQASDGGAAIDQTNVYCFGRIKTNTDYGKTLTAVAPIFEQFALNGGSGARWYARNLGSTGQNWGHRFFDDYSGTAALETTEQGQVATYGRVLRVTHVSGAYTVKRNDDVLLVDTSVSSPLALPSAAAPGGGTSTLGDGQRYYIKDVTGGASGHNIVVTAAGADTIDGAASRTIAVNYGSVELVSTGTGWAVI